MSELKPTAEESIRHFEAQQKRYVREHNGKPCPHYANAIEALRRAQPANEPADAVPVVRGEWVDDENGTEWDSHQCSVCKKSPLSEMIYEDDYDEGLDGEWFYLGKRENGIIEHLTNYCPNCGAKMDKEDET